MKAIIVCIIILLIVAVYFLNYGQNEYFNNNNNNLFYVNNSRINGVGVFCGMSIQKGNILFKAIEYNKKITPLGTKVNHCNNPNSQLVKMNNDWYLISIKNIDKNSEITADYNFTPDFIKKPDISWTC